MLKSVHSQPEVFKTTLKNLIQNLLSVNIFCVFTDCSCQSSRHLLWRNFVNVTVCWKVYFYNFFLSGLGANCRQMLGNMRKNTNSKWSAAQDEGKINLWISKSGVVSHSLIREWLIFLKKTELFGKGTIFPWVSFLEEKAPALLLPFLRLRRDNLSLCSPFTGEVLSLLIPVSIPSYSSSHKKRSGSYTSLIPKQTVAQGHCICSILAAGRCQEQEI